MSCCDTESSQKEMTLEELAQAKLSHDLQTAKVNAMVKILKAKETLAGKSEDLVTLSKKIEESNDIEWLKSFNKPQADIFVWT